MREKKSRSHTKTYEEISIKTSPLLSKLTTSSITGLVSILTIL